MLFAEISFPLLFTCSWPDLWVFSCLFTIKVDLLIGRFLKCSLFFDGCTAVSILSIRSFMKDLTSSSIFSSIRTSLIMLLNPSASKETVSSGKSERKLIYLSSSTKIAVPSATSAFLVTSATSTLLLLLFW